MGHQLKEKASRCVNSDESREVTRGASRGIGLTCITLVIVMRFRLTKLKIFICCPLAIAHQLANSSFPQSNREKNS